MKQTIYSFLIAVIAGIGLYSCSSDDDSSSLDVPLSFSAETITFDTIFTEVGSATLHFKIYNRNNRSLDIQTIELASKGVSGFRLNVDGDPGTSFSNIEILKKDSLFVFVEITVDPSASADLIIKDSIRFTTNGVAQYVKLEAIGLDVHKWDNKTISQDMTIVADKPILVYNTLKIEQGAKLTIPENTTFYFRRNAKLEVHGTLDMQGSPDKPIVLRGERFDKINSNILWDNVSGQWDGVVFHSTSYNNHLQYVLIKNSAKGVLFHDSDPSLKKADLIGVTIQNTSANGLFAINCNIDAENCLFANTEGATLKLAGGKYNFNFCTIANYYKWATRRASALVISNFLASESKPLIQCNIYNSIIYGSSSDELSIDKTNNSLFNCAFSSCIIRDAESQESYFDNITWNKDPLFVYLNNSGDFSYNFELKPSSPAINAGDNSFPVATDIKGRLRPNNRQFDLGCYEYY